MTMTRFGLNDLDHNNSVCGAWIEDRHGTKIIVLWINTQNGGHRQQCKVKLSDFMELLEEKI